MYNHKRSVTPNCGCFFLGGGKHKPNAAYYIFFENLLKILEFLIIFNYNDQQKYTNILGENIEKLMKFNFFFKISCKISKVNVWKLQDNLK